MRGIGLSKMPVIVVITFDPVGNANYAEKFLKNETRPKSVVVNAFRNAKSNTKKSDTKKKVKTYGSTK
jgi:hypothetical protein